MKLLSPKKIVTEPFRSEHWIAAGLSVSSDKINSQEPNLYSIEFNEGKKDPQRIFEKAVAALMSYRIYPPSRMQAYICTPDKKVSMGATIIQRILLGPIVLEGAVRVTDLFNREDIGGRTLGFTYATLKGHPETGTATFSVCKVSGSGRLHFSIKTQSYPCNKILAGLRPVTSLIQKRSNNEALHYFRSEMEKTDGDIL